MSYQRIYIQSVNWVGDAIMTTPAIHRLRVEFPAATIVVGARPWVAPALRSNPDVDEVWAQDSGRGRAGRRRMIARIQEGSFDLGVAFPNSFGSAWLLYRAGIPRRLGYGRDMRSWLLTDATRCDAEILKRHQVYYYLNILRPVLNGEPELGTGEPQLVLELEADAVVAVERKLTEWGVDPRERLIGINPGAFFGTAKRWLPERFAETADRLARKTGGRVVLTGTPNERVVGERIGELCEKETINLAGEFSLSEAVALIDRFSILITNDSGAMHLAAARGVPLVAVFGSTDWRTTYPFHPAAKIVRRDTPCAPCLLRECPIDHRCMTQVTVDEVVAAAEELLTANNEGDKP